MSWRRNDVSGSIFISGAALAASVALAVAAHLDVLPPLFPSSNPVLHGAVIIGLSIIASSLFAVVLGFYLLQVRAIHEIMARLDSLDSMLKDAEAMADEHSKAMARRDLEDSDGAGKGGNARPPVARRLNKPSQSRPAAESFPHSTYTEPRPPQKR